MKTRLLIIALFLCLNAYSNYSYLVVITKGLDNKAMILNNTEFVEKVINLRGIEADVDKLLQDSNFFEIRKNGLTIYVEKKKVVKKRGKIKHKRIK